MTESVSGPVRGCGRIARWTSGAMWQSLLTVVLAMGLSTSASAEDAADLADLDLEASHNSAKKAGLKLSSKLLRIAQVVE